MEFLLVVSLILLPACALFVPLAKLFPAGWPGNLFAAGLALGGSAGLSGLFHFLALNMGLPLSGLAALEVIAYGSLAACGLRLRRSLPNDDWCGQDGAAKAGEARWLRLFPAAAVTVFLAAVSSFIAISITAPHGSADSFTIWNFRARSLFRLLPDWKQSFTMEGLGFTYHLDYPILTPAFLSRCYRYLGHETPVVPAACGLLFLTALVAIVAGSVWLVRTRSQGSLAALTLLTPAMVFGSANQFADVPLTFFVSAAVALLALSQCPGVSRGAVVVLAGCSAGLGANVKNEGLLLLITILCARYGPTVLRRMSLPWYEIGRFAAGLAIPLAAVIYFKLALAGTNDLVAGTGGAEAWGKLTSVSRWYTVAAGMVRAALRFGYWPVSTLVLVVLYWAATRDRMLPPQACRAAMTSGLTYALALGGYFGVYMLTPHDLEWHLMWSANRLLVQTWPLLVLTVFWTALPPERIGARAGLAQEEGR